VFTVFLFLFYCNIAMNVFKKILAAGIRYCSQFKEVGKYIFIPVPYDRVYAVAYAGTLYGALYKAGILELFKVLRNGSLCQAQLLYQIATDAGICPEQLLQDGYTRRVCNGFCHCRHFILCFAKQVCFRNSHIYRNITIDVCDRQIYFI
jgi:hypothetical protein